MTNLKPNDLEDYCSLGQHQVGAWGIEYHSYINLGTKMYWMESRCKKHNCHLEWKERNSNFHYSNWGDRAPLYQFISAIVILISFMSACILAVDPNVWWIPLTVFPLVLALLAHLGVFKRATKFSGDVPTIE